MSTLNQIISLLLEQELEEVAVAPSEAEESGYGVYTRLINFGNEEKVYILYDLGKFKQFITSLKGQVDAIDKSSKTRNMAKEIVLAYVRITWQRDCKSWVISSSAAVKGFGPLIYDIALSDVGKEGIMPDRETVSNDARRIWSYYFNKRKNEFKLELAPFGCQFGDPEETEGSMALRGDDFLNYRYVMLNPIKSGDLIDKGNYMITNLAKGDNKKEKSIKASIEALATIMFHTYLK